LASVADATNTFFSACYLPAVCLLLSDGAIPVSSAALEEAVSHHAMAKHKKDDCQEDYKQELSNSERRWPSPRTARRIQISCHQSAPFAKSSSRHGTVIYVMLRSSHSRQVYMEEN